MKYFILNFILFFASLSSFGQEFESYKFDYSSLYTKKNGSGEMLVKRYIIGNTNDDSYFLYLFLTPNDSIFDMSLVDTKNNRHYQFNFKKISLNNVKNFGDLSKKYSLKKSDLSKVQDRIRYFDIKYENNDDELVTVAKVFKNKKRNKLVAEYHYYIKQDSTETNKFYAASTLLTQFFPVREIRAKGVLSRVDTFDGKSETILFRDDLIESNQLQLILNLQTDFKAE